MCLFPRSVDFRKPIDGFAALVEQGIKMMVFDAIFFVFLCKLRNRVRVLYGRATASTFCSRVSSPKVSKHRSMPVTRL
ncbi:IS66 family insertion sequence element accessory protein TnpB [Pseudomonas chlororaphis]|uniref:IS66 family insertion sequence element accessory protein TnpB n=1 Tax=Pseudomonas chlororaphis TaxID=587753 RepID=UPI0039E446AE